MFTGGEGYKSHVKDSSSDTAVFSRSGIYSKFYERTNKLVTALFMVTDIMDREEPLRIKLRALGANILSDMYANSSHVARKITEILSFLNIAQTVGMISEMNSNVLRKEFSNLQRSFVDVRGESFLNEGETALMDFLREDRSLDAGQVERQGGEFKGHERTTRVGVQKGGTLMKALSDKISDMSVSSPQNHDVLKQKRRGEIIEILKDASKSTTSFYGLTITDIKNKSTGVLASAGEKTLQREIFSMVSDGILKKSGEKRWSRYFLTPN